MDMYLKSQLSMIDSYEDIDWKLLLAADDVECYIRKQNQTKMQEPDYTASIVLEFPRHCTLPGVKFGGVFIHQKPYISYENPVGNLQSCELGDLLVLCRKQVDGEIRYNAALLQLKIADGKPEMCIGKNSTEYKQLFLYTKWPQFWYGRKARGNSPVIDINPKTVRLGAQYMFIKGNPNPYPYSSPLYTHAIPSEMMPVDDRFSFGRFIFDFINWQNGTPISAETEANQDQWSRLIWSVIRGTQAATFKRKGISQNRLPRIGNNNDFLSLLCERENNTNFQDVIKDYFDLRRKDVESGDGNHNRNYEEDGDGASPAMSILMIDVQESSLNER